MYRNVQDLGLETTALFLSHTTGLLRIRPDCDLLLSLICCIEAAHRSCICRTEIHYDKYYTHKAQRYNLCSKHITNQAQIRNQDKYCSVIHLIFFFLTCLCKGTENTCYNKAKCMFKETQCLLGAAEAGVETAEDIFSKHFSALYFLPFFFFPTFFYPNKGTCNGNQVLCCFWGNLLLLLISLPAHHQPVCEPKVLWSRENATSQEWKWHCITILLLMKYPSFIISFFCTVCPLYMTATTEIRLQCVGQAGQLNLWTGLTIWVSEISTGRFNQNNCETCIGSFYH